MLLVSGLWRNDLIAKASKLALIQSISAGLDQYSRESLSAAGVRLASAQGVNERAVAEHAIALILALARQIPQARDNQTAPSNQIDESLDVRVQILAGCRRTPAFCLELGPLELDLQRIHGMAGEWANTRIEFATRPLKLVAASNAALTSAGASSF